MDIRRGALDKWLLRLERRSELSDSDRAHVLSFSGEVETFGTSRDIVRLGERTTHSCLIAEGVVARFGQTDDGLRQLTAIFVTGDMGDLHSAVLPRVSDTKTIPKAENRHLPNQKFTSYWSLLKVDQSPWTFQVSLPPKP